MFTYVQNKITPTDFLLDDSVENLKYWDRSGTGIRLINEVNDKDSSWDGEEIYCNKDSLAIAYQLKSIQNRCILNELMYNKNFFIEEEKENIELKGKNHSISIADRMKNAKQKASQQTKETKKLQKDIPQR